LRIHITEVSLSKGHALSSLPKPLDIAGFYLLKVETNNGQSSMTFGQKLAAKFVLIVNSPYRCWSGDFGFTKKIGIFVPVYKSKFFSIWA
jgi:hypothetical protein